MTSTSEKRRLTLPATDAELATLRAGDTVLLSGVIYTARDAAHKRLTQELAKGIPSPMPLTGSAVYYAGPSKAPQGYPIGSCGPTTSARMDAYAPELMRLGLRVMIGKGPRSAEVQAAIRETGSVYLVATGGAGALLALCVKKAELIAYEDLGTEAIRKLTVEDFPAIVAIAADGSNLFNRP